MKKLISLMLLVGLLATFLTGCGKDRILFKNVNLSKCVELSKYKGIEVKLDSDTMKEYKDNIVENEIADNNFYKKITEGTVKNGDTVNIDYIGRKDGIAFDGGYAEGYELEIGSNSFIAGFEEGLIGKEIGSTVDLNLNFPNPYPNSPDLAGKPVVFTVKINYIPTKEKMTPEEYYSELGFKTYEEYSKDAEERAIRSYLLNYVLSNSLVTEIPEKEQENLLDMVLEAENYNAYMTYKVDLETYVKNETNKTLEQYTEELESSQVVPMINNLITYYAILDKEEIEIDKSAIDKKIKEQLDEIGGSISKEQLIKSMGEYYFESQVASEQAYEIIRKSAVIK